MKRYAMVLLDRVIDLVEADIPPVYPSNEEGEAVISIECDDTVQIGDIVESGVIIGTGKGVIISEPTQLDRIETMVAKSQQDIIDEYTLSLIEEGVI